MNIFYYCSNHALHMERGIIMPENNSEKGVVLGVVGI